MALVYNQIGSNKTKTVVLITGFLVFIIGLGYLFSYQMQDPGILVIAVAVSVGMSLISYFYSDKIVLKMSKAKEVPTSSELYKMVDNLAITAGLPAPKVYLIEDSAMNAFATGRDPKHAVIVFTTGIVERLEKTELEGVAAHEMMHIGNYDIRLSTIVVVLVGVVALISDWFLRMSFWGGRRRDENGGQVGAILAIAGIVLAILSPIIATLIQLAISRQREYLADASGVLLTRYPQGLANALRKISADHEPLEVANKATAHLYIANPLKDLHGRPVGMFATLFATHPPIEERIRKLEEMGR